MSRCPTDAAPWVSKAGASPRPWCEAARTAKIAACTPSGNICRSPPKNSSAPELFLPKPTEIMHFYNYGIFSTIIAGYQGSFSENRKMALINFQASTLAKRRRLSGFHLSYISTINEKKDNFYSQ
jgi:hypothetical protein